MATCAGANALNLIAQSSGKGYAWSLENISGIASVFNSNGVPTVWVFLALGVVLALVFVKLLFINKRRPREPGDIDSWSG